MPDAIYQHSQDENLMLLIAQGDRKAFAELLSRHLHAVVRYALKYMRLQSDAEDVAQEVFLRVWQKASDWKPQGFAPRSWIYRITYNLCIDEIRRRKDVVEIDEEQVSDAPGPEERLVAHMEMAKLQQGMASLPERQQTAVRLCAYEGLTNIEAAKVMDCSVEALESLLSRGRRTLRIYMQG